MTRDELIIKLAKATSEVLGIDEEELTIDANFQLDLGADSLDLAELYLTIEDALDIRLKDDELKGLKTIKDFADYLEPKEANAEVK